jgi:hypothetical protein
LALTVKPQPARELSVTVTQLARLLVPVQVTGTTATTLSAVSVMPNTLQAGTVGCAVGVFTQA